MTSKLGAASAEEVADLATFTSITQVVFAQMFDIDVSMITVSSVEVTSASAVLIAFSAAGRGCRGLSAAVTLELGSALTEEVEALASFTSIILVVFAQMFVIVSCGVHICKCHFHRVQRRSSLLGELTSQEELEVWVRAERKRRTCCCA